MTVLNSFILPGLVAYTISRFVQAQGYAGERISERWAFTICFGVTFVAQAVSKDNCAIHRIRWPRYGRANDGRSETGHLCHASVCGLSATSPFVKVAENGDRKRLAGIEGEDHKFLRKQLLPAFSVQHVRSLAPMFWSKSTELVDLLREDTEKNPSEGVPVYEWLSRAALDISGVASLGSDVDALSNPNEEVVKKYSELISRGVAARVIVLMALLPVRIALQLPLKRARQMREGLAAVRGAAQRAVQARRQTKTEEKDILSQARALAWARSREADEWRRKGVASQQ